MKLYHQSLLPPFLYFLLPENSNAKVHMCPSAPFINPTTLNFKSSIRPPFLWILSSPLDKYVLFQKLLDFWHRGWHCKLCLIMSSSCGWYQYSMRRFFQDSSMTRRSETFDELRRLIKTFIYLGNIFLCSIQLHLLFVYYLIVKPFIKNE